MRPKSPRETVFKLIKQIVVSDSQVAIEVKLKALMSDDARVLLTATHRLTIPIDLGQQDGGNRDRSASDRSAKADPALVKALARGFAWFEEMATGSADTVTAIANRERVTDRYVSRLVELAFIDPRIIQRALAGTARPTISTTRWFSRRICQRFGRTSKRRCLRRGPLGRCSPHSRHLSDHGQCPLGPLADVARQRTDPIIEQLTASLSRSRSDQISASLPT